MTLPRRFAETRESLHALAEHVLCAARYRGTGRIGLQVVEGGFGTPPFGDDGRTVAVRHAQLVLRAGGQERRAAISTLRAAGDLVGIVPGAPSEVFTPTTPCDPDAPLTVDAAAAEWLADWYALGDEALRRLTAEVPDDRPSGITLWPEHFDVAIRAAEVNYGASPGDREIPESYLYIGPTALDRTATGDAFWNAAFGAAFFWNAAFSAAVTWESVGSADAALDFFRQGRWHALG